MVAAWRQAPDGALRIATRAAGGVWRAPTPLPSPGAQSTVTSLAIAASGGFVVTWVGAGDPHPFRLFATGDAVTGLVGAALPLPGGSAADGVRAAFYQGDNAVGVWSENQADTPVRFSVLDRTPPSVVPSVLGTLGQNGWYVSDVDVSWTVSDVDSGIASTDGCGPVTISSDTIETTITCRATNGSGLETAEQATVKRDATPPLITHTVEPPVPNGDAGWYITAPTVKFNCSDATSGIASCVAVGGSGDSKTLGESASPQTVTGEAADNAGHTAPDSASGLLVDLSDPRVICAQDTPQFHIGAQNAIVSATVKDTISGPAAKKVSSSVPTDEMGFFSVTLTGRDKAGRIRQASCPYAIVFKFTGYFAPLENPPTLNLAVAGRRVAVIFSLAGDQGLDILGPVKTKQVACDPRAPTNPDLLDAPEPPAPEGDLSYDPGTDRYTYVWGTSTTWLGKCRVLTIKLIDATVHTAKFKFVQ